MKNLCAALLCLTLLTGCGNATKELEQGLALRAKLLAAQGCAFTASITADYGDKLHTFSMECRADCDGDMEFSVIQPDSIAGIEGEISGEGGKLTFDDTALYFDLLADGYISPVSAPWILVKTLRGGFLTSSCREDGLHHMTIDDSYEDDALQLDIWLDGEELPVRAEILYGGRRILTLDITNFEIL